MKKRVLSVLLAAVMVFPMAGCSGGGSSSESSDDTAASASEDTVERCVRGRDRDSGVYRSQLEYGNDRDRRAV